MKNLSPSQGDVIVYQTILTSSDISGYDIATGTFTAPVAGVYMFTVNSCVNVNHAIAIMRNGIAIFKSTHNDARNTGSCYTTQSITPLVSGDQVLVKCDGSCRLMTDSLRWNTFSGILLRSGSSEWTLI